MDGSQEVLCHLPMGRQVDKAHWLPSGPSTGGRPLAVASKVARSKSWRVEVLDLQTVEEMSDDQQTIYSNTVVDPVSSWEVDGRITGLKVLATNTSGGVIVAGTSEGTLYTGLYEGQTCDDGASLPRVHQDGIVALDIQSETRQVLSVDEVGMFCLTSVGQAQPKTTRLYKTHGAISIGALQWTSRTTFVTGGQGNGLQSWDVRQATPASKSPTSWASSMDYVTSIDVHHSRKYLCAVGDSSGSVAAWDLRWQREPLFLSTPSKHARHSPSTVWQVNFDRLAQYSTAALGEQEHSKLPPVMLATEDGQLALAGSGDNLPLVQDTFAVTSFDIDTDFGQDIICTSESEKLIYLKRRRYG